MQILIKNGTVITQNNRREIIPRGDILITNSSITSLGKDLSAKADQIIDAEGLWILPGLINTHVHLGESIYATLMPRRCPLEDYLEDTEKIARVTSAEEKRSVVAKYSALQMLKSGTTCIGGGRTREGAEALGMRNVSGYMLMLSGKLGRFSKDFMARLDLPENYSELTLTSPAIFIHSLATINQDILTAVRNIFVRRTDLRLMIHVGESTAVVSRVKEQYGDSEIGVLGRHGLLSERVLLIHGNRLNERDLNKVQACGATLVHCLSSNANTADATIDINDIFKKGINICVATDGVVTSSEFSVLREAGGVYKYHNRFSDETLVTAGTLLDMITINGAKALGLQNRIGSLEVGKAGDLVILKPPFGASRNAAIEQIIHYANLIQVKDVIINGQLVFGRYQPVNRDHAQIEADFAKIISETEGKITDCLPNDL